MPARAQGQAVKPSRRLIAGPVDQNKMITLPGNVRPEANAANDRGAVADGMPLEHMQLQLRLPAEKQQELDRLTHDQQDSKSPNYHKWLTAQQFRERFSLAPEDIAAIAAWLKSEGFTVNGVNAQTIDFSGNAGQVRGAFRTQLHTLDVDGEKHFANMSDPQIPAGLAPAVAGVVSLNDFKPHPLNHPQALYSAGGTVFSVVPTDLAAIYNLNPLFAEGYTGQGQTIALVEDTDIFPSNDPSSDWNTFRTVFGLAGKYPQGSLTQIQPQPPSGANNCTDPGARSDDNEAILDAEWASAAAPNAAIVLASCTSGIFTALQNLLESASPPQIVSISYAAAETTLGSVNLFISALYQQGAAEGVSIFAGAGDSGAAASDPFTTNAIHGINVNGIASTPYNVAVGGTDFSDFVDGINSTYWSSTNTAAFGSALSYVPEIPWDNSCASGVMVSYLHFPAAYGSNGLCNSPLYTAYLFTVAGSGGASSCGMGKAATAGVVSGTCAGYTKPEWQSVFGNPSDGVRDIPDVSLFAANGVWDHAYVFCWSDTVHGGRGCTGAPSAWNTGGGTSFSSPIMAGIQALINQKAGGPQGNPAPTYYSLAAAEFGSGGNALCDSSKGNQTASACTFYDVTRGDIEVNCTAPYNCYAPAGTYGVMSLSTTSLQPAYATTAGWDFATGIGTVNAFNLANNWPGNSLSSQSGTAQSAIIGTVFSAPLLATVKDGSGNPLSGVVVTFAAPGSGAGGTFVGGVRTATTDASGTATSPIFVANGTPGGYSVIATAEGQPGTTTFALTNVDFGTVQQTPETVQVTRGAPATVALALTTTPGNAAIPAEVSVSCAVPTALTEASCSVNPAMLAAGNAGGSSVTLTVTTTAPVASTSTVSNWQEKPSGGVPSYPFAQISAIFGMIGAAIILLRPRTAESQRTRMVPASLGIALLLITAGLVSCGGGSPSASNETPVPSSSAPVTSTGTSTGTPGGTGGSGGTGTTTPQPPADAGSSTGAFSITVTAVAAGMTRTTTVPINVN